MRLNRKVTIALAAAALSVPLTMSAPRNAEAFFVAIPIAAVAMWGALVGGAGLGASLSPQAVTNCQAKGYRHSRSGSTYDPHTGQFNGYGTYCSN